MALAELEPIKRIELARDCETQDRVTVNFYSEGDIMITQGEDRVYLSALQLASLRQITNG